MSRNAALYACSTARIIRDDLFQLFSLRLIYPFKVARYFCTGASLPSLDPLPVSEISIFAFSLLSAMVYLST